MGWCDMLTDRGRCVTKNYPRTGVLEPRKCWEPRVWVPQDVVSGSNREKEAWHVLACSCSLSSDGKGFVVLVLQTEVWCVEPYEEMDLARVILRCCSSESSGGSKDVFLFLVCCTPRAFSIQFVRGWKWAIRIVAEECETIAWTADREKTGSRSFVGGKNVKGWKWPEWACIREKGEGGFPGHAPGWQREWAGKE